MSTKLDANQVIKHVFDEPNLSLRTTAVAVISDVTVNVDIDASEDSIAIKNGNNQLAVNSDGSINVRTTQGVVSSYYNEIENVSSGITSLIIQLTAPPNSKIQKVCFSGSNIAEYELTINNVVIDKQRTYFGNSLNGVFDFQEGLNLTTGSIIRVYVYHIRPSDGDFNARIQLLQG